jgi:hypothetical protein
MTTTVVPINITVHRALGVSIDGMSQSERSRGMKRRVDAEKYSTSTSEGLRDR